MNPHDGMSPGDPLGDMLRAWSGMVNAALPPPEALGQLLGGRGAQGCGPAGHVNQVLMQAHFVAAAALMRVWNRSAQSLAQVRPVGPGAQTATAAQAADEGQALARLVDDARAHLRRMSEITLDESRRFEIQMQALGEELRTVVVDPIDSAAPRRYARTKP